MNDLLRPKLLKRLVNHSRICDRPFHDDQIGVGSQIIAAARRIVIDDTDLMAARKQPVDQVRPNKPSSPCYQHLHASVSPLFSNCLKEAALS